MNNRYLDYSKLVAEDFSNNGKNYMLRFIENGKGLSPEQVVKKYSKEKISVLHDVYFDSYTDCIYVKKGFFYKMLLNGSEERIKF